jgi:hypothetical protein
MAHPVPPGLTAADEGRHVKPEAAEGHVFGDTLWVSVVDPKAGLFGINHFHLTTEGYARFEALYLIDGVPQLYGNKFPLDPEPDAGPWSDGRLSYEVVDPFEHIRIQFDGRAYGFDLDFKARFGVFDYEDCVLGDPLKRATPFHLGHFEQGMSCTGSFEIRGGPAAGQTRQVECWSHRDHSWSDRFSDTPEWQVTEKHIPVHYWPSIQLSDRHINVFGLYPENQRRLEDRCYGGFVSSKDGNQAIPGVKAEISPNTGPGARRANSFRYEITLPGGDVIHVRSTRHHGTLKLWDRAENELENRLDCYEAFVDFEVEETGEVGTGVAEHSIYPCWPQWLV